MSIGKRLVIGTIVIFTAIAASEQTAFADDVIKAGIGRLQWNVEGNAILLPSWHIQYEHFLKRNGIGFGFQFRKESELAYEGYYIGSYAAYKTSRRVYLFLNGGAEFGISSIAYSIYETQGQKGYVWQRWAYLDEPAIKGVGVFPFSVIGLGFSAKHFVIESGAKIQLMRFGVKETLFGPGQSESYAMRDGTHGELIPSAVIQVGFKF